MVPGSGPTASREAQYFEQQGGRPASLPCATPPYAHFPESKNILLARRREAWGGVVESSSSDQLGGGRSASWGEDQSGRVLDALSVANKGGSSCTTRPDMAHHRAAGGGGAVGRRGANTASSAAHSSEQQQQQQQQQQHARILRMLEARERRLPLHARLPGVEPLSLIHEVLYPPDCPFEEAALNMDDAFSRHHFGDCASLPPPTSCQPAPQNDTCFSCAHYAHQITSTGI